MSACFPVQRGLEWTGDFTRLDCAAMSQLHPLNATALRNRLAQRGLRQWWLAEQLGVDRRTVLRWVNGQVRQIQPATLQALAGVLGCPAEELLLHDPATQLATAEDQRAAGLAIAASTLMDRLGPVGEWDVIERLVKASAVPDLPLDVLGRLYHQLCVACWRQSKLAEADAHNAAALALARRCGDRGLLADALGSRANLLHWRGEVTASREAWREALALAEALTPRQRGALHNNLGGSLLDTGELEAAEVELKRALACFAEDGTAMNRAITHDLLALLAVEREDPAALARHAAHARAEARAAGYARGLALALLLDALQAAARGDATATRAALAQGLADFTAQGIAESLNHRLAARAWRWLGDRDAALAACAEAERLAPGFPLEAAAAARERAAIEAMSPRDTVAR